MTSTERDALLAEIEELKRERDTAGLHVVRCENALRLWLEVMLNGGDAGQTTLGIKKAVAISWEILGLNQKKDR